MFQFLNNPSRPMHYWVKISLSCAHVSDNKTFTLQEMSKRTNGRSWLHIDCSCHYGNYLNTIYLQIYERLCKYLVNIKIEIEFRCIHRRFLQCKMCDFAKVILDLGLNAPRKHSAKFKLLYTYDEQ